jgi:hypothetical protein
MGIEVCIVFTYECKNNKTYSMWAMSINGPKFYEISLFETLYIAIKQLILVTLEHFIHINN